MKTKIKNIDGLSEILAGKQELLGFTPENIINKGASNGYAELDSNGRVPSAQLPSYVDDVLGYSNFASFPVTGEDNKIYIAENTNITYRWSGTAYVPIGSDLALGETSATAYRGDRGKAAYDHSQITTGNPHNLDKTDIGLGSVDNTSDLNKPVSTAVLAALNLKADTASVNSLSSSYREAYTIKFDGGLFFIGYYDYGHTTFTKLPTIPNVDDKMNIFIEIDTSPSGGYYGELIHAEDYTSFGLLLTEVGNYIQPTISSNSIFSVEFRICTEPYSVFNAITVGYVTSTIVTELHPASIRGTVAGFSDYDLKSMLETIPTEYAKKDSPTFTGTPSATTAPVETNDDQIATTAFVKSVVTSFTSVSPSTETPLSPTNSGDVGTATEYAKGDHAHPKETLSGSSTFNSTTGVTITHNLGNINYKVSITPTSASNGYLGEYYVVKNTNTMVVYCTGSTTTTTFDYVIIK